MRSERLRSGSIDRRGATPSPFSLEAPPSSASRSLVLGDWPTKWRQGDLELDLSYEYEPGTDNDGVTDTAFFWKP